MSDNIGAGGVKIKSKYQKHLAAVLNADHPSGINSFGLINSGLALVFVILSGVFAWIVFGDSPNSIFIILAATIGAYMAINIGANDVANNIGPAFGSKALTMASALVIAAIFETSGALLAGGDVVSTIAKGVISPESLEGGHIFLWAMTAALLSAALWINIATWAGAPVSTTHSIVGGVMGAGIGAAGLTSVHWGTMAQIAASWVISPVMGGLVAALFLTFIKNNILRQPDRIKAARHWVPVLIGIMAAAFAMYLSIKGLKKIWNPEIWQMWAFTLTAFVAGYFLSKPAVERKAQGLENRKKAVNTLFTLPLIASAALLSFAHGANDVANAVGPLSAIVSVVTGGAVGSKVSIPLWVMVIGALGISVGLLLFGPKLIRTVGQKITRLDQIRAFCVALSAAITVIAASWLAMPVSSTHIAVGGVFGVGFLREAVANRQRKRMLAILNERQRELPLDYPDELVMGKRRLVRRRALTTIVAAWLITVPCTAALAAVFFLLLNGMIG